MQTLATGQSGDDGERGSTESGSGNGENILQD